MTITTATDERWIDCLDRALTFVKLRESTFDADEVVALAEKFYAALISRESHMPGSLTPF